MDNTLFQEMIDHITGDLTGVGSGFMAKYGQDLAGFVEDCIIFDIGDGPTSYQKRILVGFPSWGRTAVRGPRGLGKTTLAAWIVLWAVLTSNDVLVMTTAGTWRQLQKFLWPEIHKWVERLNWEVIGRPKFNRHELTKLSLKLGHSREAFAAASTNPDNLEGGHAKRVVIIFDEAKAIPNEVFDALEGTFSTSTEAYALAISTPGAPQGRFYDIHVQKPGFEDWHVEHVTLEEAIANKRIDPGWAAQRRRQWGEQSAAYLNYVLGEFAESVSDGVIQLSWVELAQERWHEWVEAGRPGELTAVGVDVARFGDDKSVLARRFGNAVDKLSYYVHADTMQLTGYVAQILDAHPVGKALIDVIGLGAGVFDRLNEISKGQNDKWAGRLIEFEASAKPAKKDSTGLLTFLNRRTEAWWHMRELLNPDNGHDIALPPDPVLLGDLTAPNWETRSDGKIFVESKKQVRKRLKRSSTDAADAVIQAFYDAVAVRYYIH